MSREQRREALRLGRRGEEAAREFLAARGYELERTNVRYGGGEIDLVALDGETLCFIEVRSASSMAWGGAAATVVPAKQRRMIHAARCYLSRRRRPAPEIRFDVLAIQWHGDRPALELFQGAFDAPAAASW
jgi:putative endonuclease